MGKAALSKRRGFQCAVLTGCCVHSQERTAASAALVVSPLWHTSVFRILCLYRKGRGAAQRLSTQRFQMLQRVAIAPV